MAIGSYKLFDKKKIQSIAHNGNLQKKKSRIKGTMRIALDLQIFAQEH